MISQGTEDALKLETLQKLSESSNFDLRAAALRIVAERSTKGSTRDLLLRDLASKDKERRNKALTAMHFLVSNRALARSAVPSRLKDLPTYIALVDCLCNFLEEHTEETGTTESPILPKTRPPGEKKALSTLNIILSENIPAALEAGIVSRWLCNYPFPCLRETEHHRRDVVWLMKTWWSDDSVMSSIINTLMSHQDGIRQLRKYGLMGSMMENDHDDYDGGSDVWMVDGDDTAGSRRVSGRRQPDENAEEQALRRRRREAMVFSEGGRPLDNDNIIQPPPSE
ncbi:hypothetical protein VTN96DRAFT_1447 [Rasamsonia emersonii]